MLNIMSSINQNTTSIIVFSLQKLVLAILFTEELEKMLGVYH